jgi:acyl dehydratase
VAIDYFKLKNWPFADVEQDYSERQTILYALAVGMGYEPTDPRQLSFVYEKKLKAMPTMAVVLAHPGLWMRDEATGIDWLRVVHGEHSLTVHRPLSPAGYVVGRTRVRAIVDKGEDRGALILWERTLHDDESGELLATIEQLTFCRGDGGFSRLPGNGPVGGDAAPAPRPDTPAGVPEATCVLPTLPQSALIYRLCGDTNPLHADPEIALAAGFPRPILHGLASFGFAAHAILRTYCEYDPARLHSLGVRFSSPLFPGEALRFEFWRRRDELQFRACAVERDALVLSHGTAKIA